MAAARPSAARDPGLAVTRQKRLTGRTKLVVGSGRQCGLGRSSIDDTCGVVRLLVPLLDCEASARGQANEVVRVRQAAGLIEVVDPPHEATLGVPPRPEVLDVQVTDPEDLGRLTEILAGMAVVFELVTDGRPPLRPAVRR